MRLDPKHLPYNRETLFKIKGKVYEIMVRHRYWNGKEDAYRYELREYNKIDSKPFLVQHEYLYKTEKQTSNKETKKENRWKR